MLRTKSIGPAAATCLSVKRIAYTAYRNDASSFTEFACSTTNRLISSYLVPFTRVYLRLVGFIVAFGKFYVCLYVMLCATQFGYKYFIPIYNIYNTAVTNSHRYR
jgi:hypothetical protein